MKPQPGPPTQCLYRLSANPRSADKSSLSHVRLYPLASLLSLYVLLTPGCTPATTQPTLTTLTLGPPIHTQVQRLGINLAGQNYYDSGQLLRNLTSRNPGFEGGSWATILHCKSVTATTCTEDNQWTVWPPDFLAGAHYDILPNGPAGTVTASSRSAPPNGVTLTLAGPAPAAGAFLAVRIDKPGNAETGWWTQPRNGATLSTEFNDLSPATPGKQALRIEASGPPLNGQAQSAKISSFFDSYNNRSFLQLRGRYTLTFRMKSLPSREGITGGSTSRPSLSGGSMGLQPHDPAQPKQGGFSPGAASMSTPGGSMGLQPHDPAHSKETGFSPGAASKSTSGGSMGLQPHEPAQPKQGGFSPGAASITITRLDTTHGNHQFLTKTIPLTPAWHDYTFTFEANETEALGPIELAFEFTHTSALLDDVALTEVAAPSNPTAFRNAVVKTLRDLHPGVLRYMDSGPSFGSSLANLLAPQFARKRTGASTQLTLQEDIPLSIPDFLTLCQAVGADPWLSLPPALTPEEARTLIAYLTPWTRIFKTIHLELGNEQWNQTSFAGATINSPQAYAQRAATIFAAFRSAPAFAPSSYDLILGSWATVPWYTMTELAATKESNPHSSQPHRDESDKQARQSPSGTPDSVAVAPYLFNSFNDAASTEAIFGPMFAQPEQIDSRPSGYMAQQLHEAQAAKTKLAVYEVNLSTVSGSATQTELDRTIPSLGAGLTLADHMLLMLRDLGVTTQCLFSLPEYVNGFAASNGQKETTPLWGSVIDMGGPTNLRRPQFLALQLINAAILPTMLSTNITGPQPTWNQPLSQNDKIELRDAHALQTFAFADGSRRSLILLNLSRTESIPIALPVTGLAEESRLTSPNLTDTNETHATITPTHRSLTFTPGNPYVLPPHSLTTLTWNIRP